MSDKSLKYIEMEEFLKSIGGFENGYFTDREPIFSPSYMAIGEGWYDLVKELTKGLIAVGWNRSICQIKSKFGGLRFYIGGNYDNNGDVIGSDKCDWKKVDELISAAERKSFTICEVCGEPGKPTRGGWIDTLCPKHTEEVMADESYGR